MNILFFGDLNKYGRAIHRRNSLVELGHNVQSVSYVAISVNNEVPRYNIFNKILWRLKVPIADHGSNKSCIKELQSKSYDLVWVDNGLLFFPSTLYKIKKQFPKIKIILFSEDDLCVWHGMTLWLLYNFSRFSAIFTTKEHNLTELKNHGQKNVFKIYDSYIPILHRKISPLSQSVTQEFCCDVSAIGAYEEDRANSLEYLAKNGIKVLVWGMGWRKFKTNYPDYLVIKDKFLVADEYSFAINCSKININFLRKINRDTITSRSIEIPACGGFMISERTYAQNAILLEGIDAEYFSSNAELLSKVRAYLNDTTKRELIALSGYNKVHSLSLDIKSIVNFSLEKLLEVNGLPHD
jgi:spore maturation protein CgeB